MLNKIKTFFVDKKIQLLACPFIAILFVLDIWTKRLAFSMVDYMYNKTAGIHTYLYVNEYFNIVKVINNGVSFGMFRNLQQAQIILSFITFCIILFVIYLLFTTKSKYKIFSYSLIIAGGFGNIYDRIFYGGVFDFLDFHLGQYHWPAFNVADSLICIGVFLLLFESLLYKTKKN